MSSFIHISAIVLYLLGSITVGYLLTTQREIARPFRLPLYFMTLLALVMHSHILYKKIETPNGLSLGLTNMFSLITALMVAMLLLAVLRRRVENLSIAILPLAAIAMLLQWWIVVPLPPLRPNLGLESHILLSVVAFSLLSIGALQALLLALQDRHLRTHRPNGFISALPPMESMESLLFQILWTGFIVLTLALFNGLLDLRDMFAQHLTHKTVLSLFAWLVFATLLWGRWRYGWRGRTAIRWTLIGIISLLLAYFGSRFVLEVILHRP